MSKHIVYICNEYPPYRHGGIGVFVKNLAESLVKDDFEVTVIGHYSISETLSEVINGVRVIRLSERQGGATRLARVFKQLQNKYLLSRYILNNERNLKLDLIESYEWNGPLVIKPRTKLIVRLHGSNTAHAVFENKKTNRILRFLERKNLSMADEIISVSKNLLKITEDAFGKLKVDSQVIYNSYNNAIFFKNDTVQRSPNKILFVGKFHERKGVFELFKILEYLFLLDDNITFQFVGAHTDENESTLLSLISSEFHQLITFTKAIPQEELPRLYNTSSLMIMPSRAEAFGLTAIEAMACGCVVAMANIPVASEIIDDNKDGLLIAAYNPKESAERIKNIIDNRQLLNSMSEAAVSKVLTKFSSSEILRQNKNYYNRSKNEH
jgi:glycosyltransferase involved in cell wall biosynthesis